jgi:zinc protease
MNRRFLLQLLTFALLISTLSFAQQTWKDIKIPPLPEFKPVVPVRVQLPNGMVLFLQEDHELPLIDGVMRIRGGSIYEPAEKVGLTDIYGEVWRTGGTTKRTGDELDDFLEVRAAQVETDAGADATSISFSCLKGDFEDVFNVFTEVLRDPAFREEKIAIAKDAMYTGISRRNDDPGSIAGRESLRVAYGKDNPWARIAEYATVAKVNRDDLVSWHKQYVHPNNIIFGIVGDFDAKQMEARIRQAFGSWQKGPAIQKPKIAFADPKPGIYFVNKSDVTQSEIRFVELGIQRNNPDYFATQVMNEIFGGGFSSRLFSNIRTKLGLAYSVGGGIGSSWDHPGITRITMGTKSQTTVDSIKALYSQIDDLVKEAATAEELQRGKDAILNSFVFEFDTPEKVLRERMTYEFYGYPQNFLEQFRTGVEKATAQDVANVARKYVHRDKFAIVVVGNTEQMGTELSSLGPVTPIDITIPPPPGEEQAKPATAN